MEYRETFVSKYGKGISKSLIKTDAEIKKFEDRFKDEIDHVTLDFGKRMKIIHMADGSRFEYKEVWE